MCAFLQGKARIRCVRNATERSPMKRAGITVGYIDPMLRRCRRRTSRCLPAAAHEEGRDGQQKQARPTAGTSGGIRNLKDPE